MKKVLSLVILSIFTLLPINAATFQGGVAEQGSGNASRIIDKQTGEGVGGADIRLPKQNYSTRTGRLQSILSSNNQLTQRQNKICFQ